MNKNRNYILPIEGETNILVTAALPYVNNEPHLGNLIGSVLSADIYARAQRSLGYNVLFICGSDEYGTASEDRARKEGISPKELCDKYHQLHQDIYRKFNISFDYYGRTNTPEQTEIAHYIYQKIWKNGLLMPKASDQFYCLKCKTFLADRFITGTCPRCKTEKAKGDECDTCGYKFLSPTELINPGCATDSAHDIELRATENLYLRLPNLTNIIAEHFSSILSKSSSTNVKTVTNAWLDAGLHDRCITRDLKWGTSLPKFNPNPVTRNTGILLADGYDVISEVFEIDNDLYSNKVFYVWADAVLGYISITYDYLKRHGYQRIGGNEWRDWWKPTLLLETDIRLVQFIGKDNIPFHSIIFPGILKATDEIFTLPTEINSTEYLMNPGNTKFSKSLNQGIFCSDIEKYSYPIDTWRCYLAFIRPTNKDAVFDLEAMRSFHNDILIANLGNLVNRVLNLSFKHNSRMFINIDSLAIDYPELQEIWNKLRYKIQPLIEIMIQHYRKGEIRQVARNLFLISSIGNGFIQEYKPWTLFKSSSSDNTNQLRAKKLELILLTSINIIYLLSTLMEPLMPDTALVISTSLSLNNIPMLKDIQEFQLWLNNHRIKNKPVILFNKIEL